MSAETQNGVELRNSVDNSSAEAGLRDLERSADATSRRIAENQAKASERAARAEEAAERRSAAAAKRGLSVGIGIATAAAGALGGALRSAGAEEAGSALEGAASGAARLGTMLAPLGPQAMAAGAAVGALGGAVSALAGSSAEAAERMRRAAQALRDEGAAIAIEDANADTPEAKAEQQRQARLRLRNYAIKVDRGASVSEKEVLDAARWDPALAARMLGLLRSQNGGKAPDALLPLETLYAHRSPEELEQTRQDAEGELSMISSGRWRQYQKYPWDGPSRFNMEQWSRIEKLPPEIVEAFRTGSGFNPEYDALPAAGERSEGRGAEPAEGLRGADARGGLLGASADALGSKGIGHAGNPMRETETLLREIRDDARRAARRPGGAFLA